MSDSLASAKRTRSQLALPDDILHIPERSPMKDARIALRLHGTETAEESDDELLLSPGKANASQQRVSSKRSASPSSADEYRSRSASPSDRRAPKRLKRDVDVEQDALYCPESIATLDPRPPSARSRSASQPIIGSPHSDGLRQSSASRAGLFSGKDRARSVPIFSSSFFAPHIDLRNPPPSPWRARSRSPSKEREMKLRVTPGPTQAAKLETISDGNALEIHTTGPPSAGTPRLLTMTSRNISPRSDTNLDTTPDKGEITNDNHTGSIPILHEPPSTPATTQPLSLTFPLSPLTPLPPTPLPACSAINSSRYATAGWTFDSNEEDKDEPPPESKLLPVGTTKQSRLPRLSSMKSLSSLPRPSPSSTLDPECTTHMGHSLALPSSKQPLPVGTPTNERQSSPKPPIVNAFTVLMAKAYKGKRTDQPKGKAKERPSSSKGRGPSSLAMIAPKQKGGNEDKRTLSQPKISIKAKMRPKEKHTPKPKPTSAPVDVADEDEAHLPAPNVFTPMNVSSSSHLPGTVSEDQPMEAACAADSDIIIPSSRMHSPVNTPQPVLASRQVDVPMESMPGAQSDVAPVPAFSESLTPTPMEDSTPTESHPFPPSFITSELRNEMSSVGVARLDKHLEEPSVNIPFASRAPVSKLPLVKRIRPITTTDRVTRRMSQRQREKQAESSSQALRNTSPQQRTNTKKPISAMPSDFKEETSSSSQVYIDSTMSNLSDLSDVPTDPDLEEEISPGSPMKLSSPLPKASESTFARPTQSSATKIVLPKTPSKAKLPPKLTSPSTARFVRSASVSSMRPPGGLTRTFTGFGSNQGSSSLSTLANALEKLRMPAPERPNTSMGFSRELDVDRDLETTKYSTDDSSTRGRALESTMLKRTASLESAESGAGGSSDAHSHGASVECGPSRSEQKSSSLITRERVGKANLYSGSGLIMRGGKSMRALQHKPRNFGIGSGRALKVSRKTSLPSVTASPIKGSGTVDVTEEAEIDSSDLDAARPNHADALSVSSLAMDGEVRPLSRKSPSRRVSLASQALSQSLSSLPSKQTQVMGPPTTPPNRRPGLRSSSSSYPSSTSSATSEGSIPSTNGKFKGSAGGNITSGKSTEHPTASSNTIPESLKILQDCVIFVDVRTDDGDEAGSLFVEMLEGVGAKILTRVGQTCTHIVYKNGLMSTLTRYRLLRDPKPLVVGIAWVVECVEQRQRVDESKFLVDLDGVNVAGTNKRRRSMLPKLIRREAEATSFSDVERNRQGTERDQSMDGSSSSVIMDEEFTPLELARRRKTGMRTP